MKVKLTETEMDRLWDAAIDNEALFQEVESIIADRLSAQRKWTGGRDA